MEINSISLSEMQTETPTLQPQNPTHQTTDQDAPTQAPPANTTENSFDEEPDPFLDELDEPAKPSAGSTMGENGEVFAKAPAPQATTPEIAMSNTQMFLNLREMVQGGAIAFYADGNVWDGKKYYYDPAAKQMLAEAWAPIIEKSGIKVSPWMQVAAAEAMATGPLVALAVQARKYRKEADELRKQIAEMAAAQGRQVAQDVPQQSARKENKSAWKIDNSGYFEFDSGGAKYIKKTERTERPRLPQDYNMLVEHNGKAFVHSVFNLPLETESEGDAQHTV